MNTQTLTLWRPEEYTYKLACGFIPNITTYLHDDEEVRPGMLVVPGGGYGCVSPTEGELVALKFYELGYQAFVLTYTTNILGLAPLKLQPLMDLSRAVRVLREKAPAYRLDPDRLSICGFSAGGHLCASLCVHFMDVQDPDPRYAAFSNRPDAAVLSYPVITAGEKAHRGSFIGLLGEDATEEELDYMSLEKHVSPATPPCFLWATATDEGVPVENSELFEQACRENGVPCAFHMFSNGRHGLSLADDDWANGVHMATYTDDQNRRIAAKAFAGELAVSEEQKQRLKEYTEEFHFSDKPNREVAVWPCLADAFLREQYKKI